MLEPKKIISRAVLIIAFLLPVVALAIGSEAKVPEGTTIEFTRNNPSVVNYLFGASILLVSFFLHRTLTSNDSQHKDIMTFVTATQTANEAINDKQWKAISKVSDKLTKLQAEHNYTRDGYCHARCGEEKKYPHRRENDGDSE